MSEINPLETVIADSVDDAVVDSQADNVSTSDTTTSPDSASSGVDSAAAAGDGGAVADTTTAEGADAVDSTAQAVQDEFEKRWGISAQSITGRENRIPHSRVKTMVTKAEQDGYARGVKEGEGKYTPRLTEFETKVKDYEGRLEKVAQFEQILENDPRTFLSMLSQVPAYKEFFDYVGQLAKGTEGAQPIVAQPSLDAATMPQPDQTLPDGSKVYSMEGLSKRDEWLAKQIEDRAVKQAEDRLAKRYAPIEQEWQQQQRTAQLVPVIEKQIADARTWPNFQELEPEVIKILKADQQITLERAYVKAYQEQIVPRMSTDRNKIRTELLAELKQKPVSSSAPASAVRPGTQPAGPRTLDQVVADAVREAGLSGT